MFYRCSIDEAIHNRSNNINEVYFNY